MNAHRRMKSYMDRHKIGLLFEELMSKLMSEMPSEPVPFLIRQLQHRLYEVRPQTVMTLAQLRRSLEDLTTPLEVEKAHVHKKPPGSTMVSKRRPATASTPPTPSSRKAVTLFCPGDIHPSLTNLGKVRLSNERLMGPTSPQVLRKHERDLRLSFQCHPMEYDRRKLVQLTKPRPPPQVPSSSPDFRQFAIPKPAANSEAAQADPHQLRVNAVMSSQRHSSCERAGISNSGYSRSLLPGEVLDENPLRDEIARPKMPAKIANDIQMRMTKDLACADQRAEDSRKLNDIKSPERIKCRYVNDREAEIEMYENPEDLAREGIFVCKASNLKVYKFVQPMRAGSENWRFTICSTCAKIVKTDEPMMNGASCHDEDVNRRKNTCGDRSQQRRPESKAGRDAKTRDFDSSSLSPHIKHECSDATSFRYAQDSGRSMSTEDLFAETPRSLPLPATPTNQEVDWCYPSVEFLKASSSGWTVIGHDRSETDSP